MTPAYSIYLTLVGVASELSEAIRKHAYDDALVLIPRLLGWLLAVANRAERDERFTDIARRDGFALALWHKFPNHCAVCGTAQCSCVDVDKMSRAARRRRAREIDVALSEVRGQGAPQRTIDEWTEALEAIYSYANRTLDGPKKTFHFLEEVGELELAMLRADEQAPRRAATLHAARQRPTAWELELADCFGWLVATYQHIIKSAAKNHEFVEGYRRLNEGRHHRRRFGSPLRLSTLMLRTFVPRGAVVCYLCRKAPCIGHWPVRR